MSSPVFTAPVFSLVIPIFNEEAVLPILLKRIDGLLGQIAEPTEVIFVDDGSRDTSGIVLAARARADARIRYIALSRNFGHQIAISAGMDAAAGQAVIVMDADLQDPPEVVLELIRKWREGYEIVHARRRSRDGESRFKLWSAALFYRGLRLLTSVEIPADVGDFRLIDRKALDTFRAMPERHRFVRGMFGWMGFRQGIVEFERAARAAGTTKYSLSKMLRLALDGVVSFSDVPLRLALWLGAAVSGLAVLYGLVITVLAGFQFDLVSGWASTVVLISLLSGANLMMTGIVGLYVGRIHAEVKGRPLYVVGRTVGFERAAAAADPAATPRNRRAAS